MKGALLGITVVVACLIGSARLEMDHEHDHLRYNNASANTYNNKYNKPIVYKALLLSYYYWYDIDMVALAVTAAYNISQSPDFPFALEFIEVIYNGSSVVAMGALCDAIHTPNFIGVVGPTTSDTVAHTCMVASSLNLPVLSPAATATSLSNQKEYPTFFRDVPEDSQQVTAVADVINYYGWQRVGIIYSDDIYGQEGQSALTTLLGDRSIEIVFTLAISTVTPNASYALSQAQDLGVHVLILWSEPDVSDAVLPQARDADMLQSPYLWFVSEGVASDFELDNGSHPATLRMSMEGILGVLLPATSDANAQELLRQWLNVRPETYVGAFTSYGPYAYDTVFGLAIAMRSVINQYGSLSPLPVRSEHDRCFSQNYPHWDDGDKLIAALAEVNFVGMSGNVSLRQSSTTKLARYDIVNYHLGDWRFVTRWNSETGFTPSSFTPHWPGAGTSTPSDRPLLETLVLRVATKHSPPFVIYSGPSNETNPSPLYFSGFCITLLQQIALQTGMQYTLFLTDLDYSDAVAATGKGVFDMFIADTTVTSERAATASLSVPFFSTGLQVMTRKVFPPELELDLSAFEPLSAQLWVASLFAMIATGLFFKIFESDHSKNINRRIVGWGHAMFNAGMLSVLQASDFTARSPAAQLLFFGSRFLFTLVISSYTANLAQVLVSDGKQTQVAADPTLVQSGLFNPARIVMVSSTALTYMQSVYTPAQVAQFQIVADINTAYSMIENGTADATVYDAETLEYALLSRPACLLAMTGESFLPSVYAIAATTNAAWLSELNTVLVNLQESGFLDETWSAVLARTNVCQQDQGIQLTMRHASALFFIWFGAVAVSLIIHFFDVRIRPELRERKAYEIKTERKRRIARFNSYATDQGT